MNPLGDIFIPSDYAFTTLQLNLLFNGLYMCTF